MEEKKKGMWLWNVAMECGYGMWLWKGGGVWGGGGESTDLAPGGAPGGAGAGVWM